MSFSLFRLSRFIFITLLFSFVLVAKVSMARGLPDFVELVEDNSAAVVNISTTQKLSDKSWQDIQIPEHGALGDLFKKFFEGQRGGAAIPPPQDAKSLGSGFILSSDGYVLTNHHVIDGADEIVVRLSDKRELTAELIGSDQYSDIALLKISADHLPVVNIGSSENAKVGEWVLAIGSPFGFDHSVTSGIISAKGRSLPSANYVPFIQTDVAINPGNSGGPLFNLEGNVIGVNSQIYSRTGGFMGLSFAIPIEVAMEVVEQLKNNGRVSRGWLGVYIQEVTQELAQTFGLDKPVGALVSQVIKDSPAEAAGVKAGDVILKFNNKDIIDSANLPPLVGRVAVGSNNQLRILRNGKYKTLNVLIKQLPKEANEISKAKNPSTPSRLGILVAALDKKQFDKLGRGVSILQLQPNGVAQQAGLRKGDILLQINRQDIKNVADFRKKVANLPTGRMIPVLVHRQGADQFVVLKLPDE